MAPIKIIIADDHPLIRHSLKLKLNDNSEFKLVGEAANGIELIDLAKRLKPDIVITDIKMPVMDGIEATKQLTKLLPGTNVIALSMMDDKDMMLNMLYAGAKGYLLKDVMVDEITTAINTVHLGLPYFSKQVYNCITKMITGVNFKNPKLNLSQKENTIIQLICREYSTKQIADHLKISKRAVDGLRDNILKKINAKNTAGLVVYAMKQKIWQ